MTATSFAVPGEACPTASRPLYPMLSVLPEKRRRCDKQLSTTALLLLVGSEAGSPAFCFAEGFPLIG